MSVGPLPASCTLGDWARWLVARSLVRIEASVGTNVRGMRRSDPHDGQRITVPQRSMQPPYIVGRLGDDPQRNLAPCSRLAIRQGTHPSVSLRSIGIQAT